MDSKMGADRPLPLMFMFMLLAAGVSLSFSGSQGTVNANVTVLCPFYLNLTAQPLYVIPGNLSFNYSLKTTAPCTIPKINGSVIIWNANTTPSNYVYKEAVSANDVTNTPQTFNVVATGKDFTPGNYYVNVSFYGPYYKESTNSPQEFTVKQAANLTVNITYLKSSVPQGSFVTIIQNITNRGGLASSPNTTLHISVTGPDGFYDVFSYPINSIAPMGVVTKTLVFSDLAIYIGNYTVKENATYYTQYKIGNIIYTLPISSSPYSRATYTVSKPITTPRPTPIPPTTVANVSYASTPVLVSVFAGQSSVNLLDLHNGNSVPVWINLTDPGAGCSVSFSSYNNYLLPAQNADIGMVIGASQNASAGTYIIPIQETITAIGSLPAYYTQYVTCAVSEYNTTAPSLLNTITAQNSSKTVQGTVQVYNPTNRSLANTTASISLPLIVAKNESYISISGAPGSVSTVNGSYVITWDLPYMPKKYTSTVYYTVRNASNIQAVESTPIAFSVPITPRVSAFSIFNIGIPTVYTGSYSVMTVGGMYVGTAPNNITFSLVGPPSVMVTNSTQTFKVVPNTVLTPSFGLLGPANSGTYIMTLYISGAGIKTNSTFDLVVLPFVKPVTTTIITTTVPQISTTNIMARYEIPAIAAAIAIIAFASYLVAYKRLNKPKYSRDRARELSAIKEQVKRGGQS